MKKNKKTTKNKASRDFTGKIIAAFFLLVTIAFMAVIYRTRLLPPVFLGVIGAVLAVIFVLVTILVWKSTKVIRFIIGTVLASLLIIVYALGSVYIIKTTSALSKIAGADTEVAQMGVYVLSEDTAENLEGIKDYTFGVLSQMDQENTNATVAEIQNITGSELQVHEVSGLNELVESLMNHTTGAVILNKAYISILEEVGIYDEFISKAREIDIVNIETEIEIEPAPEASAENNNQYTNFQGEHVYMVYISGIDNRGGIVAKSRSDVNIIAIANTDSRQLLLISTPRDFFVPLSISNGQPDKLTHAGIYGIKVCMDTLGMLYDRQIDYYFRVNFSGFENIIDALGGITVYSDYDFDTKNTKGFHFNKGENFINGEQALAFTRERYAFSEGDRQRGRNQLAVIKGVVNKALSPELLKNYSALLNSVEGCFETNFSYEELAFILQRQLKNGGGWNIVSYSVDGTGATEKPYSMSVPAYVMKPDYTTVDKAKQLIEQVYAGEVINLSTESTSNVDSQEQGAENIDAQTTETQQ